MIKDNCKLVGNAKSFGPITWIRVHWIIQGEFERIETRSTKIMLTKNVQEYASNMLSSYRGIASRVKMEKKK